MLSKANGDYAISTNVEPMQYYYMVNVKESSSEAISDLSAADPCSFTEFIAGTSSTNQLEGVNDALIAYRSDGSLAMIGSEDGFSYKSYIYIYIYIYIL